MYTPFRLSRRNYYPWLFLGLVVAANALVLVFLPSKVSPELLLSITGGVAALVHFLYAQHNNNTDRFIGLFKEFNARYDLLNDKMNTLVTRDGALVLAAEDTQLLFDYFNLCAEEYLYFKAGYIDIEVWGAWLKGMKYFADRAEIRRVWKEELASGSYYGFGLDTIDAAL